MLCLIALFLVSAFLLFFIGHLLGEKLLKKQAQSCRLQSEYATLLNEGKVLTAEREKYQEVFEQTTALYDLIKELCKSLDEAKIFKVFKESVDRHVRVEDCRFIKNSKALAEFHGYTIIVLTGPDNQALGYLTLKSIQETEREKFTILAQQFIIALRRAVLYQKMQDLSINDTLTRLYSRRYFLGRLNEELERSKKYDLSFSFLMLDIDNFKYYNDHYGHLVGDAILRQVSAVVRQAIREVDFIGRYGGDEICIVLVETDKSQAGFAAERIRRAIEVSNIKVYDEELKATIGIGVATFPDNSVSAQELIEMADHALYAAKYSGKNKVCFFERQNT